MLSWDDMRIALTLAEHGTLSRAGHALGVDPTTVSRRITALEKSLGVPLFVRLSTGWRPTEPGERVLAAAQHAAVALRRAEHVAEEDEAPVGVVRVTAMESVASNLVVPVLPSLTRRYPGLRVHLVCTPRTLDLMRGEADIALRVGRPTQSDLIAKRLTTFRAHVYASAEWLAHRELQADAITSLDGLPVCELGGRDPRLRALGNYRSIMRSNSLTTVVRGVVEGAGLALIPERVAARQPNLVPIPNLQTQEALSLWLIAHRDVSRIPRVRAVVDAIEAQLK